MTSTRDKKDAQAELPFRRAAPEAPAPRATAEDASAARPGSKTQPLSVKALVAQANRLFEQYIGVVWVRGEVSDLKASGAGHRYFVLKDGRDDTDSAQVSCVVWRSAAARLKFRLEDGQRLLVRGRLDIYPGQGRMQLHVDAAEPDGLGADALALTQLKERLAKEGLFATEKKRDLPRFPRGIGVVTSPTGAAIRDIVRTVHRRYPVPILVSPARVQGEGAPQEIANALARLDRYAGTTIDVVIVGRGGGSAEDLAAFNDERVVRAICACSVPVISAVGHEVDITLADLAADRRAATPTAAAELAVPDARAVREDLEALAARLGREMRTRLRTRRDRVELLRARLGDPRHVVVRGRQRIDDIVERLGQRANKELQSRRRALFALEQALRGLHPKTHIAQDRARLDALLARAHERMLRALKRRQQEHAALSARVAALSPLAVLERGYAIVRTETGQVLIDPADARAGDRLLVRLARGEIDVRVAEKESPSKPRRKKDAPA